MARHRDEAATRGLSRGPVIAVAVVVVLALLTFGWFRLRDTVAQQGVEAAATCVDGARTVDVAADPDIADALSTLADGYNATAPVVRDQCITIVVHPLDSAAVLAGLVGTWDTASLGPRPAAWVAQDTGFTSRLPGTGLDGDPTSVASSPLVLAVPQGAGAAVTEAGLTWAQLPSVVARPDGWSSYGQPTWGALKVALPTGAAAGGDPTTDAGTLAPELAQAVASGLSGGTVPASGAVPAAVGSALAGLGGAVAKQPAGTTAALAAISGLTAVPGSPYQAVPATEQQVYAAGRAAPGTVSAALLTGGAPAADYPFAVLAGDEVDETQSRAAAAFEEVVSSAEGQDALGRAGFRTASGTLPEPTDAVPFGDAPASLPRADAATAAALATALRAPR